MLTGTSQVKSRSVTACPISPVVLLYVNIVASEARYQVYQLTGHIDRQFYSRYKPPCCRGSSSKVMLAFPVPACPPKLRSIGPIKSGELYTFARPEPSPVSTPTRNVVFGKHGGGVKVAASWERHEIRKVHRFTGGCVLCIPDHPCFPCSFH